MTDDRATRFVIVPPTPAGLCWAAAVGERFAPLAGGRKLVETALAQLAGHLTAGRDVVEVLVLLGDVAEPERVRRHLKPLAAAGTRVNWCTVAPGERVERACSRMASVRVFTGPSVGQTFEEHYVTGRRPAVLEACDRGAADLDDYLRYKISLSFMQALAPGPLREAVAHLVGLGGKPFALAGLEPTEAASVANFRDADFPYLEGKTPAIAELKARVARVGATDLGVLVVGATGTGKEAVAFYLHEFSPRRAAPFVSINCAGLDETFLRSELFGHEKGAFTGAIDKRTGLVEQAEGGTLFLDELPDLAPSLQADLLRFLQTKRYRRLGSPVERQADLRLVAAAQPGLLDRLRPDLYFRIAEVTVTTPALADIPDDIVRVVRHLVFRLARGTSLPNTVVGATLDYFADRKDALRSLRWPGNVRELAGLVKRRLFLGDDVLAKPDSGTSRAAVPLPPPLPGRAILPVEQMVRAYVRQVHDLHPSMSQGELARRLGKSVNTVKKYLRD